MESGLKAWSLIPVSFITTTESAESESDWQPVLVSKPIANEVECDELWLEISRGENQSIMMLQATAAWNWKKVNYTGDWVPPKKTLTWIR